MSYCRFSSANYKSDVYVYDGSDGIVIHVAASRLVGHVPKMPHISKVTQDELFEAHKKQLKAIERCEWEKIDHPLAGTTTCHRTAKEAIDELRYLQYEGFFVPAFVFDALEEYVKEN